VLKRKKKQDFTKEEWKEEVSYDVEKNHLEDEVTTACILEEEMDKVLIKKILKRVSTVGKFFKKNFKNDC